MDPSSTICIYCGADRPLDQDTCPNCKRGWLDNRIVQPSAPSPAQSESVPAPPPGWFRAPADADEAEAAEAEVAADEPDQDPDGDGEPVTGGTSAAADETVAAEAGEGGDTPEPAGDDDAPSHDDDAASAAAAEAHPSAAVIPEGADPGEPVRPWLAGGAWVAGTATHPDAAETTDTGSDGVEGREEEAPPSEAPAAGDGTTEDEAVDDAMVGNTIPGDHAGRPTEPEPGDEPGTADPAPRPWVPAPLGEVPAGEPATPPDQAARREDLAAAPEPMALQVDAGPDQDAPDPGGGGVGAERDDDTATPPEEPPVAMPTQGQTAAGDDDIVATAVLAAGTAAAGSTAGAPGDAITEPSGGEQAETGDGAAIAGAADEGAPPTGVETDVPVAATHKAAAEAPGHETAATDATAVTAATSDAAPAEATGEGTTATDDSADATAVTVATSDAARAEATEDGTAATALMAAAAAETPTTGEGTTGDDAGVDATAIMDGPPEEAPAEPTEEDIAKAKRRERLVLAGVVLAVIAGWFAVLIFISRQGDDAPVAAPDTSAAPATSTSAPPESTTSTAAPTTTTTLPDTTTTVAAIDPVGDPIPASEMTLSSVALGPLGFGSTDALGRLVATYDQPDRVSAAGEDDGLCPAEAGFVAAWGPLEAIFRGDTTASELVGFRVGPDEPGHAANGLTTLSGAEVGDTVATFEAIYPSFTLFRPDGGYVLVRPSDDVTLLWGPVTGEGQDALVSGINSPRSCDGGPTGEDR